MSHLIISKKNEVHLQIESDMHVYYELADYFTFEVPGAKFMPTYKNKYWDGKIRLFNIQNNQIYVGLLDKVCLLYTSPSPRDRIASRMPSSA